MDYPKRPKFFAFKFVRLMAKVCLANEIGPEACWLLAIIAHTEDASGYRRPVTYFNGHLAPICGFATEKTLVAARNRAVKAGWLNYASGGTRRPGKYFVVVPTHAEGIDDGPIDEGEVETSIPVIQGGNRGGNPTSIGVVILPQSGSNEGGNREVIGVVNLPPFFPVPEPIPSPTPNTGTAPSGADPISPPSLFEDGEGKPPDVKRADEQPPLPFASKEFAEAWADWMTYRKEAKLKTLKPISIAGQFKKFVAWGEDRAIESIRESISNGWQGLFEPKTAASGQRPRYEDKGQKMLRMLGEAFADDDDENENQTGVPALGN